MNDADRIAAYQSAIAHPYHVHAYASWSDHDGLTVGFQDRVAAESFARGRPEPLIDLVQRERGPRVILSRRLVPHPAMPADRRFVPVDDFPQDDSL